MQLELVFEVLRPTREGREGADHYAKVIAVMGQEWRVVECSGGIQWILQRRRIARSRSIAGSPSRTIATETI